MPPARKKPVASPPAPPVADLALCWAEGLIARLEGEPHAGSHGAAIDAPLARVAERFGLDEVERATLALLGVVERSFAFSRRLRTLAGGPRVTVEVLRELLAAAGLNGLAERLGPGAPLRRHALVEVEGAADRLAAACDALRLEVGLVPELRHAGLHTALLRPQAEPGPPGALSRRISGPMPQLVLCELPIADEERVARELADGLGRPILRLAAPAVSRSALARIQRDVELDEAVLLLVSPSGEQLRGLLASPASGPGAPSLIICLGGTLEDRHVQAPWVLRREKAAPVGPVASAAPMSELDQVRLMAKRDAERALGIVRSEAAPIPRPTVQGRIVDASVRLAEVRETPAPPPTSAPAPLPTLSPAPLPTLSPAPLPTLSPTLLPTLSPPPSPAPIPTPPPTLSPTPSPSPSPAPPDDAPRLELGADASLEARARAAIQSPSAAQRIELLEGLAGIKTNAVVAALRHNARSEHPALREVAERLMGQLFGAAWNRSRAIVPPVQPPLSDDGKPD